jgi:hypothetical protein
MNAILTREARPRPIGDTVAAALRQTAIVVIACGVAGALVGGIGSRLVMRLAALAAPEVHGMLTENGNVIGEITLAGTIGLMLFAGVGSAIFGAGGFTVARPWLPRSTVLRGLVLGGFFLALMGRNVVDPANADFVILGDRLLNVAMLSSLFIAFGLVASGAVAILERRVPPSGAMAPRMWALTAVFALPVVPGLIGVAFAISPRVGLPLVGAWAAMLSSISMERRGLRAPARVVRGVASVVLLAVVAIAGSGYVDGVATIL